MPNRCQMVAVADAVNEGVQANSMFGMSVNASLNGCTTSVQQCILRSGLSTFSAVSVSFIALLSLPIQGLTT